MQQRVGGDEIGLPGVEVRPIGVSVVELGIATRHDYKPVLRQQRQLIGVEGGVLHEIDAAQIDRRHRQIARIVIRHLQRQRVRSGRVTRARRRRPVPRRERDVERRRRQRRADRRQRHVRRGHHRRLHGHVQRNRRRGLERERLDDGLTGDDFRHPAAPHILSIANLPPPASIHTLRRRVQRLDHRTNWQRAIGRAGEARRFVRVGTGEDRPVPPLRQDRRIRAVRLGCHRRDDD